jgi:predicted amidophosphoribosyltransferase
MSPKIFMSVMQSVEKAMDMRCIVCGTDLKTDRGNIPYCPKCEDAWADSGLDPHFRRAIRELGLIATTERDPKVREGIDRAIAHLKQMGAQ